MKTFSNILASACCTLLALQSVAAITLDVNDQNSIKQAASTAAYKMVSFYQGNVSGATPGLLPQPYYWWEAGGMFGALIDYWYYTGDAQYNNITSQALLWQVGPDKNYNPPNQSKDMGNDDQCFWAVAAMRAAEINFPNPPSDQPQWLALAQAVFNSEADRWDNTSCGGGLRWQVYPFEQGYNYKNSISNGCFFNLASRLAAYTLNTTYSDWAAKAWDWTYNVGLISSTYDIYDGSDDTLNCTEFNHIQWTYNSGIFTHGAATMWNLTGDDIWKERAIGLWNASNVFFTGNANQVMYEVACEPQSNCDNDQLSFKAYFSRWMAASLKVAPFLEASMKPYLITSAQAAAQQCNGGSDGSTCGIHWTASTWDGTTGVGQQMSALEVFQSLLIDNVQGPLTHKTGGTSVGNPSAGTGGDTNPISPTKSITGGDKAGAGIVTFLMIVGLISGAWWMIA
ncbi:glycoside hydrolase family 76 protein [Myriangium duriaei CBS 260.36]|uniref:Mannan endo-1,6-alpha-mannosidase n=1 Tax=Myriangium duriaei CBS 260.36 TaxID=1168546 RepID=A0A9P4IWP2_9PEZI|nr:glycoside hydrolase family 76 protein [Myriangium duriaei CBS 260.36]